MRYFTINFPVLLHKIPTLFKDGDRNLLWFKYSDKSFHWFTFELADQQIAEFVGDLFFLSFKLDDAQNKAGVIAGQQAVMTSAQVDTLLLRRWGPCLIMLYQWPPKGDMLNGTAHNGFMMQKRKKHFFRDRLRRKKQICWWLQHLLLLLSRMQLIWTLRRKTNRKHFLHGRSTV